MGQCGIERGNWCPCMSSDGLGIGVVGVESSGYSRLDASLSTG